MRGTFAGIKLFTNEMKLYWDEAPIHVIDFEGGPQCGIVEFGVVTIRGSSIDSVTTRLCQPKAPIPKNEWSVHNISTAEASLEEPFEKEWDRFALLRESGPLSAHFASAENAMLKSIFPYPRKSPSWLDDGKSIVNWGPWLDTGTLYRNLGDTIDSLRLADLVHRYNLQSELDELALAKCPIGRQKYHCALYDAIASALLLMSYCLEQCEHRLTLSELIARSQGSKAKRQKIEQRELF